MTYSADNLPDGLSIDDETGEISGTVASGADANSPYIVTVSASDGDHTASQDFTWIISNGVVTITSPGRQSSAEGDEISLAIAASVRKATS